LQQFKSSFGPGEAKEPIGANQFLVIYGGQPQSFAGSIPSPMFAGNWVCLSLI